LPQDRPNRAVAARPPRGEDAAVDGFALVGTTLDVIGVGMAAYGVDELGRELFPESPLPHRAVARRVRRLLRRPKKVTIGVASIEASAMIGQARVSVTKPRPADEAPLPEWVAYFDSRFGNLEERIRSEQEDRIDEGKQLRERLASEEQARASSDEELLERVRAWVGGEGGRGLVFTFYGLVVTATGVCFQVAAAAR
jgi:hypothetical protein